MPRAQGPKPRTRGRGQTASRGAPLPAIADGRRKRLAAGAGAAAGGAGGAGATAREGAGAAGFADVSTGMVSSRPSAVATRVSGRRTSRVAWRPSTVVTSTRTAPSTGTMDSVMGRQSDAGRRAICRLRSSIAPAQRVVSGSGVTTRAHGSSARTVGQTARVTLAAPPATIRPKSTALTSRPFRASSVRRFIADRQGRQGE